MCPVAMPQVTVQTASTMAPSPMQLQLMQNLMQQLHGGCLLPLPALHHAHCPQARSHRLPRQRCCGRAV